MRKRFCLPTRFIATLSVTWLLLVGLGPSPSATLSQSPPNVFADPAYPLPRWEHPAYGMNLYDLLYTHSPDKVTELQFSWIKIYHLPNITVECPELNYKILYRVPLPAPWQPWEWEPWAQGLATTAANYKDCIDAYEIGNEPNLAWEWDPYLTPPANPDPIAYVELLRMAYTNIKAADPQAIVVAAAMSPTGSVPPEVGHVWDDLRYLRAMYQAGAKPYFDVLGSHPFGFKYPPETDPTSTYYDPREPNYPNNPDPVDGLCFRRAEQQRAIMEEFGDTQKQIWATEFGYVLEPPEYCHETYDWPHRLWQVLDGPTQGWYLARAFEYAAKYWPWMGPIFVFNLDFSRAPDNCDPMAWHAAVDRYGTARDAFVHLRWLPKRPYALTQPEAVSVTVSITDTTPVAVPLTLESIGISPATWWLETSEPWITVTPTMTTIDDTGTFSVTVGLAADSAPPGIYTTAITLTAQEAFFSDPGRMGYNAFPRTIPVQVEVPERFTAAVDPPSIFAMLPITDAAPIAMPFTLQNTGLSPATWSAEAGEPWVTVEPGAATVNDTGTFTATLHLTEDYFPGGTLMGIHSTAITLTAEGGNTPTVIPVRAWVYDRLYQTFLPIILRGE